MLEKHVTSTRLLNILFVLCTFLPCYIAYYMREIQTCGVLTRRRSEHVKHIALFFAEHWYTYRVFVSFLLSFHSLAQNSNKLI